MRRSIDRLTEKKSAYVLARVRVPRGGQPSLQSTYAVNAGLDPVFQDLYPGAAMDGRVTPGHDTRGEAFRNRTKSSVMPA
ncbi:MAG: hypothetical protein AAFR75_07205 [Pseudomonadota bacterium]